MFIKPISFCHSERSEESRTDFWTDDVTEINQRCFASLNMTASFMRRRVIERVDEIRHFYQFTVAAQSSYPLSQSRSDPAKPQQPMEFLGFLIIGFLIAILVLPFVALAKAKRAKRGVDDLARRLSSLENELRNLRPQTVSAVQPEIPVAAPEPKVEAVPSPIPAMTPAPVVSTATPEPPPIPAELLKPTAPQIAKPSKP